jgi:phosphatidylglycerol---prolipoprotein diacylglyceryl transferase
MFEMSTPIGFINFPQVEPILFHLGPLAIRWYGIAYLIGFYLGYHLLRRLIRRGRLGISPQLLSDLFGWLILGVLVGGRAGWWMFYHRAGQTHESWYEPIAVWHGGMSFHGGLIGVVVALVVWTRSNQVSFWNLADCLALVAPIGLFFGRIANFINAELVGRPTTLPWGVIFPHESFARHPSQLYEAILEGPLLFLVVWSVPVRFRPSNGRIAALFLICYGLFRFGVEFTRQPDPQLGFILLGWLTMGQLLSAVLAITGLVSWLILSPTRKSDFTDKGTVLQFACPPQGSPIHDSHSNSHIN